MTARIVSVINLADKNKVYIFTKIHKDMLLSNGKVLVKILIY